MSKRTKRKEVENVDQIKFWIWGILGTLVAGLAFGGWKAANFVHEELASKNEVIVAQAQAQTALDLQMEDLMERIARLEAKKNKTEEDRRQITFLRGQLERVRKMRSIK